ncbi:MAG: hypothetical protein H0V04_08385 [Chloroflexi bacterium]|nr:hypothetical protein [Chloroflexota bacterium]
MAGLRLPDGWRDSGLGDRHGHPRRGEVDRRPSAGRSGSARRPPRCRPHLRLRGIVFRRDSPAEDWWRLRLTREHVLLLAISFSEHGILPVIDDVLADRTILERYFERLPRPVRLIVLAPTLEATLRRDAARDKQVAERWAYLAEPMSAALEGSGLWVDSTLLDVDETVAMVEARWDEAFVR